jgi:predicted enzyme related to lactoylglutathione lyase
MDVAILWQAQLEYRGTGGTVGKPVVHFEIGCSNLKTTSDFYVKLFEWNMAEMGPAQMIDTRAGRGIPGHMTALGHEPDHYTIFYVEVEDVQAYLDKAVSLGGKMLVPPVPIPDGTFAWLQDPEGNTVGLWKPAKK